jgi:hypothetical protein
MKTYKEYLSEAIHRIELNDDFIDSLKSNCSKILDEYSRSDSMLFRLTANRYSASYVTKSNTGVQFINNHNHINNYMTKHFGEKYFSPKCVYTIPIKYNITKGLWAGIKNSWGIGRVMGTLAVYLDLDPESLSVVFPIGNFQFISNEKLKDIAFIYKTIQEVDEGLSKEVLYERLDESNFFNNDFQKALRLKNETVVVCNSYYTINYKDLVGLDINYLLST